jgi:UDP-N-acetylmuramoyl-tripeptide--D-alanyl-D-alanine ligase
LPAEFEKLVAEAKKTLSAKALLATNQRIPGVGNGVTQDILFNARINPKQKVLFLSDNQKEVLFNALKETLVDMTFEGGRDTQTDLYGNAGGYKTILSAKTWKNPCLRCGKTTLKEMCAAILQQVAPVLATQGNLNNEIGVPQTLLRLTPAERYAVVELGANHPGEIAWTTSLVKPDVAVINNVAAAHLAGFGSLRGVAVAKTEIFGGLSASGTAVINADSEFYDWWREILSVRTVSFGLQNSKADFRAENVKQDEQGIASFTLCTPDGQIDIQLPIPGLHNVSNALAAAAVTTSLGLSLVQVKSGLANMQPVKGRFCVQKLSDDLTVIDDTYNASVQSVMAAIDTLSVMPGYRVFAFGDMGEMGADAVNLHRQIGEHARLRKLDAVLTVGDLSRHAADAASGQHFTDKESLCQALKTLMQQQRPMTILAKGARSARMEEVVAFVKSCEEQAC